MVCVYALYPITSSRLIKLSQYSALLGIAYLYISLLISPFLLFWVEFPYRTHLIRSRRAIGVTGWGFALIHALFGFFGQLGGIAGIPFLTDRYVLACIVGLISLFIFSALALTSTEGWIRRLGFNRWKLLHRSIYVATLLSVFHTLMLGTHFRSFSTSTPIIFIFCLFFLVAIESTRFVLWILHVQLLHGRNRAMLFGILILFSSIATSILYGQTNSLSVHPAHIPENLHVSTTPHGNPAYTLIAVSKKPILANRQANLELEIIDFETKQPIANLIENHEKLVHLIAVDDSLEWFSHTHPQRTDSGFSDTLTFPHAGVFYLFATVQEFGKAEVTATATVFVGGDKAAKKTSGSDELYTIEMTSPREMDLGAFLTGRNTISFRIRNSKTGNTVEKIDPYLGTLGHLVMIRQGTLDYIHIHPTITASLYTALGSEREIPFAPPTGHSGIRTGPYRLFVEFLIEETVFKKSFDFVVQ